MVIRYALLLPAMLAFAAAAPAQTVQLADVCPAGQKALRAALASGVPTAPAEGRSNAASHFTPAAEHPTVDRLVARLVEDPEQRDSTRDMLLQVLAGLGEKAAELGVADDCAGGLTVLIATRYMIEKGEELTDEASQKLAWQLQAALDKRQVRRLADADKQAVHEWAVCTAMFLLARGEAAKESGEAARQDAVVALADAVLADLFGVDGKRLVVGADGLTLVAGKPVATPANQPIGTFKTPAGWTDEVVNGMRTLQRQVTEYGLTQTYKLLVLAPKPRSGALAADFHRIWDDDLGATFTKEKPALPMLRRLRNGCGCAYDNLDVKRKDNGQSLYMGLFVLDDGSRLYPVVAIYDGWREDLDQDFTTMFDGFSNTATPASVPLFDRSLLVGTWRAGASSFADFVDSAGNYRGDASIAWGETLVIADDGTYVTDFAAVSGSRRIRSHEEGTWKVADDRITFTPTKGNEDSLVRTRRLCGLASTADGKGRVLMLSHDDGGPIPMNYGSSKSFVGELYRLDK